MKKIFLIITVLLLVLAVMVGGGYWLYTKQNTLLTSNSDVFVIESTITPDNKAPLDIKTTEEGVKEALTVKHGWNPDDITITTTQDTGIHATGTVIGRGSEMGGGIWFAQKNDTGWEIVWDGNGLVFCNDLEKYPNYPTSLIPQCYDIYQGELVDRQN